MKRALIAFTLLLGACASPQSQPYVEVEKSQARFAPESFVTADGTELPLRSWLPKKKPKAVMLALHGFNDYSRAFEGLGTYLKAKDVAVFAYDQRGFGASPNTGIWGGEENLIRDARQALSLLKLRYPGVPVFILGESMGGAIAILTVSENKVTVDGVVLTAPAVWGGEAMSPIFHLTLWMMAHTVPDKLFTGEDLRVQASDNIAMLRSMSLDPFIIKATRGDAIYGLVHLMGSAYEKAPTVEAPTLLLYGEKDEVIPRAPIETIAKRMNTGLQIIYYPEGYHMLLRDLQAKRVMNDILIWMEER